MDYSKFVHHYFSQFKSWSIYASHYLVLFNVLLLFLVCFAALLLTLAFFASVFFSKVQPALL